MIAKKHILCAGFLSGAALAGLVSGDAVAAAAAGPATLAQVVQTGAAAKRSTERYELMEDVVRRISDAAEAYAKANNVQVAIQILDSYGNIIHSTRMDGIMKNDIDTALLKARTSLVGRNSTHARYNQNVQNPMNQLQQMQTGMFAAAPGGLPIIVEDTLLGAIGVSGAPGQDELVANAGLTAVLGPQPALAPNVQPGQAPAARGGAGGGGGAAGGGAGGGGGAAGGGGRGGN